MTNIQNIPLFQILNPPDHKDLSNWHTSWLNYIHSVIDSSEGKYIYSRDLVTDLFKYNISCLDRINTPEAIVWARLAIRLYIDLTPKNFIGTTLRQIYELSDKSDEVNSTFKNSLAICNQDEESIFITCNKDSNSIFENFFRDNKGALMLAFSKQISESEFNEDTVYMARYIYTPEFMYDLQHELQLVNRTFFHKSCLLAMTNNFEQKFNRLALLPEERLAYIVTINYITDSLIELGNLANTSLISKIANVFQSEFPNEYASYQTIKSIGMIPTPLEFLSGINTQTKNLSLPEFN